ncbi:hypothetical protein Tco_1250369 [Tanacetum coccineum]
MATGANTQLILISYECGERGHTRNRCLKKNNQKAREASARAYVMKEGDQDQGIKCGDGTLIDINLVRLNTSYEVEFANGKIVSTNTILKGNGYLTKGRKTKPKMTKLGTEWKSVRRRSKIKAKESIKPKSQQKSQIVKVKVNPNKVKVSSEKLKQKIQLEGPKMPNP